jgi:hypothetical protein
MKQFIGFAIMLVMIFGLFHPLQADVYMKQKKHTDAITIMGQTQPAKDEVEQIWMTGKGIRNDGAKTSMIMLIDEKKIIMIDHDKKTYTEMPMNIGQMMSAAAKQEGMDEEETEEAAQANEAMMQGMMQGMMKMEAKVQPTAETKKINNWLCKKYILDMKTFMGPMTTEIWASEDLKVDKELYAKYTTALMSLMPGMQSGTESVMKEMEKIRGVQVSSITKYEMAGQPITSSTELIEYKEGTAPTSLFKIPAGYKLEKSMMED